MPAGAGTPTMPECAQNDRRGIPVSDVGEIMPTFIGPPPGVRPTPWSHLHSPMAWNSVGLAWAFVVLSTKPVIEQ